MALLTAIEFTETEARIVTGERGKQRTTIQQMFSVALPPGNSVGAAPAEAGARIRARAAALREALRARKLKPSIIRIIIPKSNVITRTVSLPSALDEELAGMARFEAERHIPVNPERHIVSHHVLRSGGVGSSVVLLSAVDHAVAQEHLDVCLAAGLKVERIEVSSLSAYNGLAFSAPDEVKKRVVALVNIDLHGTDFVLANEGVVVSTRATTHGVERLLSEMNTGTESAPGPEGQAYGVGHLSEIDALLDPQLGARVSGGGGGAAARTPAANSLAIMDSTLNATELRAISAPAAPLPDSGLPSPLESGLSFGSASSTSMAAAPADEGLTSSVNRMLITNWLNRLLKETRSTWDFARREFGCPPIEHIYLCGTGALIRNLAQLFEVRVGIPTTLFDPLRSVDVAKSIVAEQRERAHVYCTVLGGVMPITEHTVRVNLIPQEYIQRTQARRQQRSYATTGTLAIAALIVGYFYLTMLFNQKTEAYEALSDANRKMKARVADLADKRNRLRIITANVRDKHGAMDILEDISNRAYIPEKLTIQSFKYTKEDSVKIVGFAKELPDINTFITELRATKMFEDVQQDQSDGQRRNLPGRDKSILVLEFSITAKLPKRKVKKAGPSASSTAPKEETADGNK